MISMDAGGYRSANVVSPRIGYRKPFVVITLILDHSWAKQGSFLVS
jgi:hypothetical protein